jgi:hypothetical protein
MTAEAAERVFPLNLVTQHEASDKVQIQEIAKGEYEWSLPDGVGQSLLIDLKKFGVKPQDYDEFRFDIKPLGSEVWLHTTLFGMPTEREFASWYLKFRIATGQWSTGRYDLRVDDDGAYKRDKGETGTLRMDLNRSVLSFAGEPQWRKATFRNPRLIKWVVATEFEPRDVKIVADDKVVVYAYGLKVKNRTDKPLTAKVEIDPAKGLKEFKAEPNGTISVELAAGEEKVVPIKLSLDAKKAKELPPAYSERICPKAWVEGVADSDVSPLLGYRPMPMWAMAPVTNRGWTPASLQARVTEAEKHMGVGGWKGRILNEADDTLKYDWPVTDWVKPGADPLTVPHFGQGYRCPACKSQDHMRRDPPNSLTRHFCGNCRKLFDNDEFLNSVVQEENFRECFRRIRGLAMAWQLTGEARYADKAIAMALDWAAAQPSFTMTGYRSCGLGTRLAANALCTSWCLPDFAEARALLASYPGLTPEKRQKWDTMLIDEGLRVTRQCGLWLNQQDEYIKAGVTLAMATGYWPLLAEAIHGDFGWHAQIERGFSEEGIGHEGIAYHRMKFGCLQSTAAVAASCGLDLMTPRIKRIFDGSLNLGEHVSPGYELAYGKFQEPNYLPGLENQRKNPSEVSILYGVLPLPKAGEAKLASVHMEGSGYIMLRKGSPVDSWEIRLNYKAQLDRGEHDRYSTWFYRNNRQVDSGIGRRRYSSPGAVFQEETAAHNTIVIDGQNSRDVIGELVAYKGDGDTPLAVVQTDPTATLYEGVRQLRGIALLGGAYVVFDRVECDTPHTIDRYQYAGLAELRFAAAAPAASLAKLMEKGRFTDVVSGSAGKEMRIDYGGGAIKMRLICDQEMTGCRARTPTEPNETMDVTWARLDNAKGGTFLATFSLGEDTEPPAAKIVKSTDSEIVLEVKVKEKAYTITVKPKEKKAAVE